MVHASYTRYSGRAKLSTARTLRRTPETVQAGLNPIPVNPANALCLDFVNSLFADHTGSGRTFDRLPSVDWWTWLASRWPLSLPTEMSSADLRRLRQARVRLRRSLERASRTASLRRSDLEWVNRSLAASPRRLAVPAGIAGAQLHMVPVSVNWSGVIADVVLSLMALIKEGSPLRIRRCGNLSCSWLFYDDSRNRSRRWCDPRYCGNLIKVRRYRDGLRSAAK